MKAILAVLSLMFAAWALGFVAGYYSERTPVKRVRYSYVDTVPPCLRTHLSRRDERAVCAMQAAAADYRAKRATGRHP